MDRFLPIAGGMEQKRFVYVLRSERDRKRHYVGLTYDVATRLAHHNAGDNTHTCLNRPWKVIVAIEFESADAAEKFERYLKNGSGRAFAKQHFP